MNPHSHGMKKRATPADGGGNLKAGTPLKSLPLNLSFLGGPAALGRHSRSEGI